MVDKSENILVEFDYNNIILVDPNKVIDQKGNAKERLVRHEDLVIYANLEVKVLPRTKLVVGVAANDALQTISIASLNFLNPGNKTYMDTNWTDEITGKDTLKGKGQNQVRLQKVPGQKFSNLAGEKKSEDYFIRQSTMSNGQFGATDNGMLGITSISVRQNLSFLPVIVITMEDIKGRALFESGDNSPYASFFNLPYPMFYLTLKGYYGKAVRLPLMLQKFNTRYDTQTGNFKITLDFYTYKYTVLSEISMGYVLSTPYMYSSELQIASPNNFVGPLPNTTTFVTKGYEKIKEVYSEYISKGILPADFPKITLGQLSSRLDKFIETELKKFKEENLNPITDADIYNETLNEFFLEIAADNSSWFSKWLDKEKNFFVTNNGSIIYTFTEANQNKKNDAITELNSIIEKYKAKLNLITSFKEGAQYKINGKDKGSSEVNFIITSQMFFKVNSKEGISIGDNETTGTINLRDTYRRFSGDSSPEFSNIEDLKKQLNFSILSKQPEDYFFFRGPDSFSEAIDNMKKDLSTKVTNIETDLTKALGELVQKNSTLSFVPNIRNVLAILFANGEAFLRLLDDVHTSAWEQRNNKKRKDVILDPNVSSASQDNITNNSDQPIYPWPQYIVQTDGENGREKYEIEYPGNSSVIQKTKGYDSVAWPEVEFVEEFIRGMVIKDNRDSKILENVPQSNQLDDINRISFNAIEFPIGNNVYSNKEESKFFYEIYERIYALCFYSKLSRANSSNSDADKISKLISECEKLNILEGLGVDSPFLTQKLKINNIDTATLRDFSNDGQGESWQNFVRGIFNTGYLKNDIENASSEIFSESFFLANFSNPKIAPKNEINLTNFLSESTNTNNIEITDTFPFTNKNWIRTQLANGEDNFDPKSTYDTRKTIFYNNVKKIITNFTVQTNKKSIRPITHFNYLFAPLPSILEASTTNSNTSTSIPNLQSFYRTRTLYQQLPTEGTIKYKDYNINDLPSPNPLVNPLGNIPNINPGLVNPIQSTSILNTPFFVNAIQEGVQKFRDGEQYPFVSAAYLFLNSLPLATTREKFKSTEYTSPTDPNDVANYVAPTELNYIFASLKKFGAVHKLPYAWLLRVGSVWHRYKKFIESVPSGQPIDILDNSWRSFDSTRNYDPVTNSPEKVYGLTINGDPIDIVLEKNTSFGLETSSLMNIGFYPKTINDFNVFYQGREIIETNNSYTGTCDIVGNILYLNTFNDYLQPGFIVSGTNITTTTILSVIPPATSGQYIIDVSQTINNAQYIITNAVSPGYTNSDIQAALDSSALTINYVSNAIINYGEGFDKNNLRRDLRIIPWSVAVNSSDNNYFYSIPSHGSWFNQTKYECFKNPDSQVTSGSSGVSMKIEVSNNESIFDGSIRSFWAAPQYGYFITSKLSKPQPYDYMKKIYKESLGAQGPLQENFSIDGNSSNYSLISELLSVFDKNILDSFETLFLKFSKSVYDFEDGILGTSLNGLSVDEAGLSTDKTFKNFQLLMRTMMKIPKLETYENGEDFVRETQRIQLNKIQTFLTSFLEYDVCFKYGNPTWFNKRTFYSFSNLPIIDGETYEKYTESTPNTLPVQGSNLTLAQSRNAYPNAWASLLTNVGFSEIQELKYKDSGSYITDFFIDLNVAFTTDNIEKYADIIKIYATQKLNQFQTNPIPQNEPPPPPVPRTLAIAILSGGTQILINREGSQKVGYVKSPTNSIIFESLPYPIVFNNLGIVNEIISTISATTPNTTIIQFQEIPQQTIPELPNTLSGIGKGAFYTSMTNYLLNVEDFFNKIITNLEILLRKELPEVQSIEKEITKETLSDGSKTKVEIYDAFKALNDKWISGTDFKTKTLFEDILLLDRASRNIGDKIFIDLIYLQDLLKNINVKSNMYYYVATILEKNNFHIMNLPSYVNFYGVQNVVKDAKPKPEGSLEFANTLFGTFTNVDYRESSSKMVCFYGGKPSEQLDINKIDWRYRNDAFDLRRIDNPLVENQIGKNDWGLSNKVVGFNVDIGPQNQSLVKSFSVSQENGLSTAESLEILNEMANQSGNRLGSSQSVSLFNLYKNRSYTCNLSLMGNALLQPTMYFNLRYVPMFSGPYMITEVNHTISNGDFSTEIVGIRQATAALSKTDNYLQSIKKNLLDSIVAQVRSERAQKIAEENELKKINNSIDQYLGDKFSKKSVNNLRNDVECEAQTQYKGFQQTTNANQVKYSFKSVIDRIETLTTNENLRKVIFARFYYFSSIAGSEFQAYGNNLGAIDLSGFYGDGLLTLFNKNYFCSIEGVAPTTARSYAIFDTLDNTIQFFVNRWTPRIQNFTLNKENVTQFIFVNTPASDEIGTSDFENLKRNSSNFTFSVNIVERALIEYENYKKSSQI